MDLLKKLYLLTAENVKKARERQNPAGVTEQKRDFKVNDLVLVRDITSGTFAPRFTPNYRIIAIHGPNRIVVKDEKGNETVRRASHLKICDPKEKVTAMVPGHDEYNNFGRSTKLLLHAKDVPHLQFTSETEGGGKILPKTEISVIELDISSNKQYIVDCGEMMNKGGEICEILPKAQISVKEMDINSNEQYIVGCGEVMKKGGKILPSTASNKESDKMCNRSKNLTWLANSVNCISKGSKVLKEGVKDSVGMGVGYTAMRQVEKSENLTLLFFL